MGKNGLFLTLMSLAWNASGFTAQGQTDYDDEDQYYLEEDLLSGFQEEEKPQYFSYADAGSDQDMSPKLMRSKALSSRFQVGADYTYVRVKPKGSSTFHGNLGGLQGIYEFRPVDFFYGSAKLAWKEGRTNSTSGERSFLYIDTQEHLGYTFGAYNEDLMLTFFTGLGYRHVAQNFQPNTGSSIQFKYNEFYVPVGLLTDYAINSWFCWGLSFTWMPQIFPTVSIKPLKGNNWSLEDSLSNITIEMPFTFVLSRNKRFSLIINPFYEHWVDGKTTAKLSNGVALGIPKNTYNYVGVDVNFGYSF